MLYLLYIFVGLLIIFGVNLGYRLFLAGVPWFFGGDRWFYLFLRWL